jgi:putative toxin-antitoxin system antitoxin component (TIGR02293 family)
MTTAQARESVTLLRSGSTLAVDHLHRLRARVGSLRAVHLLGGARVFGADAQNLTYFDPLLWDKVIMSGLPLKALDALLGYFRVAQQPLLESIGVNIRSLQRKRRSGKAKLDPDTAARTIALAHLVERAIDVVGSAEAADRWLSAPNQALGGATPLELAGRPMGNQAAMNVLTSIYHGMFS